MLNRIGKRVISASRAFQALARGYRFLPLTPGDPPAVFEIPFELLGFNAEIDNVAVDPDERVKRLDLGDGRSIVFPTVNAHCAGLAKLNRNDPRRRIGAEEQFVFLEGHESSTDCADFRRFKIRNLGTWK